MPRQARIKGEYSTYHIIQRGNERKNIFYSDHDKQRFIDILAKMKYKYNFLVYAYCLMDNHIHLLLADNGNDISQIMKSINVSYVSYFNRTYKRCGHLFQDRFKSELVLSHSYILALSKYIHNNPVKSGLAEALEQYKWSSYGVYAGLEKNNKGIVDRDVVLDYLSPDMNKAVKLYKKYVAGNDDKETIIIDIEEDLNNKQNNSHKYIDSVREAKKVICEIAEDENMAYDNLVSDTLLRNKAMKIIRENSCLTLKQIGEIFGGLSESRVSRILKT